MEGIIQRFLSINKDLQSSFKRCGYRLRPRASPALWLVPMIPAALVIGAVQHSYKADIDEPLSHVFFSSTVVSCGLLVTTLIYLTRFIPRPALLIRDFNTVFAVPAVGTLLVLLYTQNIHSHDVKDFKRGRYWYTKTCGLSRSAQIFTGFISSIVGGLASSYGVLAGLPTLLTLAPGCFTVGEAVVVVHAVVIFLYSAVANLSRVAFSHLYLLEDVDRSFETATVVLQTGLIWISIFISALVALPSLRKPVPFYTLFGSVVIAILASLHFLLAGSPLLWILQLFIRDERSIKVVIYWLLCSVFAFAAVWQQTSTGKKASTSVRKIFHILAVAVYCGGFLYAPDILYLASGVIFAIFIVIETVRALQIPPLSEALESSFKVYVDEKDGILALTPLYLMAGCSAPLWLTPYSDIPIAPARLLPLFAGILSIGVGDTAASVVGSRWGRIRWPGSQRTVEGTIACALAQLLAVALLAHEGCISYNTLSMMQAFGAVVIVSMVEAKTDQVDNLVLPLVMYLMLL